MSQSSRTQRNASPPAPVMRRSASTGGRRKSTSLGAGPGATTTNDTAVPQYWKAYSQVQWTEEIDGQLGKLPDQRIGEQFGITPIAIRKRRLELGIVSPRTLRRAAPIRWTKALDKLLGTMPDNHLAKRLKTTAYLVRDRRLALGIPAFKLPPAPVSQEERVWHDWTDAQIKLLGTVHDTVLAERWGLTPSTVTRYRQDLGIPAFRPSGPVEWTKGMLNLLGDVPDKHIAREYGISVSCVKLKRLELEIPPYGKQHLDPDPPLPLDVINQIGKIPDKQLADMFQVSRHYIQIYRAKYHIPLAEYVVPQDHHWRASENALLGTMSDGKVARKLNLPTAQVRLQRTKLNIPPHQRTLEVEWTDERLAMLGTQPDHLLATQWRCSYGVVRRKREELGIARCPQAARIWTDDELALLGTAGDTDVARRLGLTPTVVRNKRVELGIATWRSSAPYAWSEQALARLGAVPDIIVANELGLSCCYVAAKRRELGRPPCRRVKVRWTDDILAKLGAMPDSKVAAELGVSVGLIRLKRVERQVPAYSPNR